MSKSSPTSHMSAARRNAETALSKSQRRQESFRIEQQQVEKATMQKTARLRELRLAKEAADAEAAALAAAAGPAPRKRAKARPKQS